MIRDSKRRPGGCVSYSRGRASLACGLTLAISQLATGQTSASSPIKLEDAIARAAQYGGQIQSASFSVLQAKEDSAQARANRLPTVNAFNQFIYTQGNGTPSGVFVANDGIHVYNSQAQVHGDIYSPAKLADYRRTIAAEAVARGKAEIAARGLVVTVVQSHYSLVASERKGKNAQQSLREAQQFLDITQKQEQGGEVAHSD